ncbi:hypothetical protein [Novosphingobium guangzhouense]|nr:hypothetical protein [Novosphingobium guangzhouense]
MSIEVRRRTATASTFGNVPATFPSDSGADGVPVVPTLRYADLPTDPKARLFGIFGTTLIVLAIAACSLLSWQVYSALQPSAHLPVFDVAMPAAPPEPCQ